MKYLYFAIVAVSLTSCVFSNCKQILLSKEDNKWFDFYQINDTLIYKCSDALIDTIIIDEYEHYLSDCNKIESSEYQYEQAKCSGSLLRNKRKVKGDKAFIIEFSKYLQDSNSSCSKYFTVYNLVVDEFTDHREKFNIRKIKLPNWKDEIETFFVQEGRGNRSRGKGRINSFYWSKEYGLVRYETKKGEVYDLYEKK